MSMIIDPLNERRTTTQPEMTEHVGHHGGRLSHPWWTALLLLVMVAAVVALAVIGS